MLHRRDLIGWITLAMIVTWPLALSGADTEFQGPKTPIAHLEVQATQIDWLPQVDYERLVLTVAGPGDLYLRQEFLAGQAPYLSLVDSKGDRLPDGSYAYELRGVPRLDPEVREKLVRAQEARDDSVVEELRRGGKLPERALVQSGYLTVQGGNFIDSASAQPDPSTRREPASKPPLRNLAAKDIVQNDDLIVQGQACIGSDCVDGDADNGAILTLKEFFGGQIRFEGAQCCHPSTRRWALQANDGENQTGDFLIRDLTQNTTPVRIGQGAPDNALTIFFNGNVGLGTLTPATRLDVKASASGQATERLQNSSATGFSGTEYLDNAGNVDLFFGVDNAASITRLNSINNNPIVILTNSVERMRVTSGGNVGIGTASPTRPLTVVTTGAPDNTVLEIQNNAATRIRINNTSNGETWNLGHQVSTGTGFVISDVGDAVSEMLMDTAGNVTFAGKLDVAGGRIGIGGHSLGERVLNGSNPADLEANSLRNTIINVDSDNNSTNASFVVVRNSDATQVIFTAREDNMVGVNTATPTQPFIVGTDATNGNGAHVTAAGVWTNGSSRVNKENIRTLSSKDAFAALAGLEPVRYNGKNDPEREEYLGFIAEEVPDLVAMNSRKGLSPMDIVTVLTKVIQEREKTISELAARLAAVEAALEATSVRP